MFSSESTETTSIAVNTRDPWYLYPFTAVNQMILRVAARIGGSNAKEVERFLKFAVVGVIGAFIDFGVLNLLQATILSPTGSDISLKVAMATGVAFISAVTSNFIWNRYWTYPDSRTRPIQQQWVQFFLVNLVGLVFRLVWVRSLYGPLGDAGVDVLAALHLSKGIGDAAIKKLGTNIAQFFAVWIVMIWNYFVNRYWTYNDVE